MVVNFERSVPGGKRIRRQICFMAFKSHSSMTSSLWHIADIMLEALLFKGNIILHIVCFSENGHPGKCAFKCTHLQGRCLWYRCWPSTEGLETKAYFFPRINQMKIFTDWNKKKVNTVPETTLVTLVKVGSPSITLVTLVIEGSPSMTLVTLVTEGLLSITLVTLVTEGFPSITLAVTLVLPEAVKVKKEQLI